MPVSWASTGAAGHRWTKARSQFVGGCARTRSFSQSLFQRLVSFKIYATPSLVLLPNPIQLLLRLRILRFQGFRLGLFTHCLQPCCGGEVLAAWKMTLMVSNSRARVLAFVVLPARICYQEAWRALELQRTTTVEPPTLAPRVRTTSISTLRLVISPLLPLSKG